MIWTQTLKGTAFDLLNPDPKLIDFKEIAEQLARINRYAGGSEKPISVAQHTLIAMDAAEPRDRAAVALHDAHEAYIGDLPTPAIQALHASIDEIHGAEAAAAMKSSLGYLKDRLDAAIFTAAGLPLPALVEGQTKRIRHADLVALVTERRDFLAAKPLDWAPEIEAVKPLPKKYRFKSHLDVADELYAAFKSCIPALRQNGA
jgi:5'-deoxynucleotidase YfbR-like HD superfamily hydrolase